ncbi:MAG: glycosyl hydrolase [Burkholderiales bacterium]
MTRYFRDLAAAVLAFVAFAAGAQPALTITHVHGLAWSADGERLMIPSHHGLAVYANGKWSKAPGPQHDYMGFSATAKHLYSSGHPAAGSGLVNPFGVIRSRDGGMTWDKLGLEGETDFHLLATSWNTNALYVWNPAPSSRMPAPGLHSTRNDGFAWKPARAVGLEGAPRALAVHPDDPATVAVTTDKGVYLSRDSGERFSAVASGVDGLSAFFELDGRHLWYGAFDGKPILARVALDGGAAAKVVLPPLARDAVAFIAQNPARRDEFAIATFRRNVYLSPDRGRIWRQIAADGKGR